MLIGSLRSRPPVTATLLLLAVATGCASTAPARSASAPPPASAASGSAAGASAGGYPRATVTITGAVSGHFATGDVACRDEGSGQLGWDLPGLRIDGKSYRLVVVMRRRLTGRPVDFTSDATPGPGLMLENPVQTRQDWFAGADLVGYPRPTFGTLNSSSDGNHIAFDTDAQAKNRSRIHLHGTIDCTRPTGDTPAVTTAPATATPDPEAGICVQPRHIENTIHVQGCLTDRRENPPSPVPGVTVSVTSQAGDLVGRDTTDATGTFDIPLPGTALDNLGKTITVHIDTTALPPGTALLHPGQASVKIQLQLDSDVYTTFPIASTG